jgi:hypothetical protein
MNNIDTPWRSPSFSLKLNQILNKDDLIAGQSYLIIRKSLEEVVVKISWWQSLGFFNAIIGSFEDFMVFEIPITKEGLKQQIETVY